MRCSSKVVLAVVCLVLLPLSGVSFGQAVNVKEMVVKGEVIKPIPGVSVEAALSQQKAKEDLVAQKQALEIDRLIGIPRPIPLPGEDKLPILPNPKKGPIYPKDGKKIDLPPIEKPNIGQEDRVKIEPPGPIVIPKPWVIIGPIYFIPRRPSLFSEPTDPITFFKRLPRLVPPIRVGGLLGSVINITIELTKKEML